MIAVSANRPNEGETFVLRPDLIQGGRAAEEGGDVVHVVALPRGGCGKQLELGEVLKALLWIPVEVLHPRRNLPSSRRSQRTSVKVSRARDRAMPLKRLAPTKQLEK